MELQNWNQYDANLKSIWLVEELWRREKEYAKLNVFVLMYINAMNLFNL